MPQERNWAKLMTAWNHTLLNSSLRAKIPSHLIEKGWLGRPGATEDQIRQLEQHIGNHLPPSYREFLAFTNGWDGVLTQFINHLWSTDEVDWFSRRNQD